MQKKEIGNETEGFVGKQGQQDFLWAWTARMQKRPLCEEQQSGCWQLNGVWKWSLWHLRTLILNHPPSLTVVTLACDLNDLCRDRRPLTPLEINPIAIFPLPHCHYPNLAKTQPLRISRCQCSVEVTAPVPPGEVSDASSEKWKTGIEARKACQESSPASSQWQQGNDVWSLRSKQPIKSGRARLASPSTGSFTVGSLPGTHIWPLRQRCCSHLGSRNGISPEQYSGFFLVLVAHWPWVTQR